MHERRDEKIQSRQALSWNLPTRNGILSKTSEDGSAGTLVTYTIHVAEQIDQLSIAEFIRPESRLNVHYHRILLPDPIVRLIH